MRRFVLAVVLFTSAAPTAVLWAADDPQIGNPTLTVRLRTETGALEVTDLRTEHTWRSVVPSKRVLRIGRVQAVVVDGDLSDWPEDPQAWLALATDADGTVTHRVSLAWSTERLFIALQTTLPATAAAPSTHGGPHPELEWWLGDSHLLAGSRDAEGRILLLRDGGGTALDGEVAVSTAEVGQVGLELSFTWEDARLPGAGRIGNLLRTAFRLGHAGRNVGSRTPQILFPENFREHDAASFASLELVNGGDPLDAGMVPSREHRALGVQVAVRHLAWRHPSGMSMSLTLDEMEPELVFAVQADPERKWQGMLYPYPFLLATDSARVALPFNEGLILPAKMDLDKPFPSPQGCAWVGLVDMFKRFGCMTILDTSEHARLERVVVPAPGDQEVLTYRPRWLPRDGRFGPNRRLRWRFLGKGGYVAMAKAYRAWAENNHSVHTLDEKSAANPEVRHLAGAVAIHLTEPAAVDDLAGYLQTMGVERALMVLSSHSDTSPEVSVDPGLVARVRRSRHMGFPVALPDGRTPAPQGRAELGLIADSKGGAVHDLPWVVYSEGVTSVTPGWAEAVPEAREGPVHGESCPNYYRYELGEDVRVPLHQLAFHDCHTTGFRPDVGNLRDPQTMWKKDLFNLLYGAMPVWMLGEEGLSLLQSDPERCAATFEIVCAVNRHTQFSEMVRHDFLTPDAMVHRTEWDCGLQTIVNFSGTGGRPLPDGTVLPAAGFLLQGDPEKFPDLPIGTLGVMDPDWTPRREARRIVHNGGFEEDSLAFWLVSPATALEIREGDTREGKAALRVRGAGDRSASYCRMPLGRLDPSKRYMVSVWMKILSAETPASCPHPVFVSLCDRTPGEELVRERKPLVAVGGTPEPGQWVQYTLELDLPEDHRVGVLALECRDRQAAGTEFLVDDIRVEARGIE